MSHVGAVVVTIQVKRYRQRAQVAAGWWGEEVGNQRPYRCVMASGRGQGPSHHSPLGDLCRGFAEKKNVADKERGLFEDDCWVFVVAPAPIYELVLI